MWEGFNLSKFDAIGFDLDMTLCRYRTKPMVDLLYHAIATFLVEQRNYPKSLMDPILPEEAKHMVKGNVIDWTNFTISRVDQGGNIRLKLENDRYGIFQKNGI